MLTYILAQRLAFANRCAKMRKMREGTAMKLQREYFSVEKDGFLVPISQIPMGLIGA